MQKLQGTRLTFSVEEISDHNAAVGVIYRNVPVIRYSVNEINMLSQVH